MDKYTKEMEEVSQEVGVRTRAMTSALAAVQKPTKKRKAVVRIPAAEYQIAYLQLRSRSLVRISRSRVNRYANSVLNRHVRSNSVCESNASCDFGAQSWRSDHPEVSGNSGSAMHLSSFGKQRIIETFPSSNCKEEHHDTESMAEVSPSPNTSIDAEIDEFFVDAEKREAQKFANKYNFDVLKDKPLQGRYKWVQI